MQDTPPMSQPDTPLPAPRARTILLLAVAFGSSALLTGWVGTEPEDLVGGQLRAPSVVVTAPANSTIEKWLVKEGELVAADSPLAMLVDPGVQRKIAERERAVIALETELRRRTAKAAVEVAWRVRAIDSEILTNRMKAAELIQKHYDQQIELHAWRRIGSKRADGVSSANSPDEVFRTVSYNSRIEINGRPITIKQFAAARNSMEVTKVQLRLCEERLKQLETMRDTLAADIQRAAGVDETQSKLAAAKADLESLKSRKSSRSLRAPAWGTVRKLNAPRTARQDGDVPVARLVDDEHRYLSVTVPARLLGRFQFGQRVCVRFNSHVKHAGVVHRIDEPTPGSTDVTMLVQPTGRLWPGVPLGTAARVVVPKDK